MLSHKHVAKIGVAVKKAARIRGGGSALPGLVVEKLDPKFISKVLSDLPEGVVIVTGTNGKTTTTKMVVELLRGSGMKVFTNRSGSNFTRGVIASLLGELDEHGKLPADIAVLELDEAYATHFIKQVKPRYSLLLNVMRDQLDRFGEIDHTARLLETVAIATTDGVVLNRDDLLVRAIAAKLKKDVKFRYFGLDESLTKLFPNDHDLYGTTEIRDTGTPHLKSTDVLLTKLAKKTATFSFGNKKQSPVTLKIDGVYNVLNAAAALTLVRMALAEKADEASLLITLADIKPAFGRGEAVTIDGEPLEIVLVKNPAGFRLALSSYAERPAKTMIVINDNYADGRDMSWLWDVDFTSLEQVDYVSGVRAYDMALRLQYDGIEVSHVTTQINDALAGFIKVPGPKRIYCTYTAMMKLRRALQASHELEGIDG